MSLLGALFKLIKKIIGAIIKFIKKYLVIILLIIVICCAIYFAPAIAAWLGSVGAPAWMTTAFQWVGTYITPAFTTWVGYLWDGVSAISNKAWTAFSNARTGTQLAVATGLAAAIAPEETAAVIAEAGELAGDVVGSVVSGLLSSPGGLILAGAAIWYFFFKDKSREEGVPQPAQEAIQQGKDDSNVEVPALQ